LRAITWPAHARELAQLNVARFMTTPHVEVCAAVFVVACEEVDGVIVDKGCGVGGVNGLHERIIGVRGGSMVEE
jgi:hypothetical protein